MRKTSRILALVMAALFIGGVVFSVAIYAFAAEMPETTPAANAAAPTATPWRSVSAKEYTVFANAQNADCKRSSLTLRKAATADKGENILATVKNAKGKSVTLLGELGEYYYVSFDGQEGYAAKADVKLAEAAREAAPSATPAASPTPSASPTPAAPVTVTSESTAPATATGGSADVWGSIAMPGYGKTYSIYCNARNKAGTDYYYNKDYTHIFAMTNQGAPVAVIMGHNMRKSGTMFHSLHHVQNAWLGKGTCERCGKSCGGSYKASTFNINYDGYKQWALVCFYETEKNEPSSTLGYNALSTGDPNGWLAYQLSRAGAGGKGMVVGSATGSDKLMILITCGDKIGGKTGARLYVVLKAVA